MWVLPLLLLAATPTVQVQGARHVVTGDGWRATFTADMLELGYEVAGPDGAWHPVPAKGVASVTLALATGGKELQATGTRATWKLEQRDGMVRIGQRTVLDPVRGLALEVDWLAAPEGLLVGSRVLAPADAKLDGVLWTPPRIALNPGDWTGYRFWDQRGTVHQGEVSSLAPMPAYAGLSTWGRVGDTADGLDPRHPALVLRGKPGGLGVVRVQPERWGNAACFFQRHTEAACYLYSGMGPVAQAQAAPLWAWLAPFGTGDAAADAARVERLVARGTELIAGLQSIAPPLPEGWGKPLPDFPASLRRPKPVVDPNEAAVFTVNEDTDSDYGVNLNHKVGSDVLIRGWFKWGNSPGFERFKAIPPQIHALGGVFGGGITCSALYDKENGITREQLLDMATRGPDGNLVDAWDQPGCRHGSLSSPAYRDYLFRWCQEQIDAGSDYLFMDESNAALSGKEGYDDASLADFRRWLLQVNPETRGCTPTDPRWTKAYGVDLADRAVCPDGTMASFNYRAYLAAKGWTARPDLAENPFSGPWRQARTWRDDWAWKGLTDRIHDYAKGLGRTVWISGNGLVKYVDLQVLGVWGDWRMRDGHVDFHDSQVATWAGLVRQGRNLAGKRVPVVWFHDWGFGDPPFPWMAAAPSERELWMRLRAPEIYAAGGIFAFPVLGPFGCDAGRDGTLPAIAKLTAFYQAHRDLFLTARYLGSETLTSATPNLSLAATWREAPRSLLVHVVNRNVRDGVLQPQRGVTVRLPVDRAPARAVLVTPDREGEVPVPAKLAGNQLELTLPELEASAVVVLSYDADVDVSRLRDTRIATTGGWRKPERALFPVRPDGSVDGAEELITYLQGTLHKEMREPPTFLVNARQPGELRLFARAVATAGARIEYRVDGRTVQTVDLPDLDGKNDGAAPEYDRVLTFPIPAGQHRLTVDNVGGDWVSIAWYEFLGSFGEPRQP